jgi:cell division transport system ATP-binding protein
MAKTHNVSNAAKFRLTVARLAWSFRITNFCTTGLSQTTFDQVGLLHKERRNPETLSAGEQQRVGIARAIVTRPKLLIADEPTGNLDPDLSLEVMRIFRRFNEVGVTLLIASHDISLIDRMGCRRIALDEGKLVPDEDEEQESWQ